MGLSNKEHLGPTFSQLVLQETFAGQLLEQVKVKKGSRMCPQITNELIQLSEFQRHMHTNLK